MPAQISGSHRSAPPWNILQLDVSTYCTLHCPTCPRTALAEVWRNAHVTWDIVERLLPYAGRFKFVHLQGWGEPLLHPELPAIVSRFTAAGTACGLTTNGVHLTPALGRGLLDAGLKVLTVSLSGATPATQALLRPPSKLDEIVAAVAGFKALAGKACEVRLSFLRQPENQHEMAAIVRLARRLKLDDVVGVNPTYQANPEHAQRLVRDDRSARRAARHARWAALLARQNFTLMDVAQDNPPSCANRPQENLTVSVTGDVSPCVFLQLPLKARPAAFDRPLLNFGNVLETDLDEIWNGPGYRAFREAFVRRETAYSNLTAQAMADMDRGDALKSFQASLDRMEEELPLPTACAGCLKAQGL
jgi:MoaA/NifB/PqqE/SkfB family radical SAM enzyme